jgi:3-oxoacyl-[acyl-carrier protein] reductase
VPHSACKPSPSCHFRCKARERSSLADHEVRQRILRDTLEVQPTDRSSAGIGAEVARELARQGASVLVTYAKSVAEAQKVVAELETIQPHGCAAQYKAVQADAANAQQAAEITVVEAKELFRGKIDIIVNNAANGLDLPLDELTTENFDSMFHTNVLFPCLLIKLSKPSLARNARIVNVSTVSARIGESSSGRWYVDNF